MTSDALPPQLPVTMLGPIAWFAIPFAFGAYLVAAAIGTWLSGTEPRWVVLWVGRKRSDALMLLVPGVALCVIAIGTVIPRRAGGVVLVIGAITMILGLAWSARYERRKRQASRT